MDHTGRHMKVLTVGQRGQLLAGRARYLKIVVEYPLWRNNYWVQESEPRAVLICRLKRTPHDMARYPDINGHLVPYGSLVRSVAFYYSLVKLWRYNDRPSEDIGLLGSDKGCRSYLIL